MTLRHSCASEHITRLHKSFAHCIAQHVSTTYIIDTCSHSGTETHAVAHIDINIRIFIIWMYMWGLYMALCDIWYAIASCQKSDEPTRRRPEWMPAVETDTDASPFPSPSPTSLSSQHGSSKEWKKENEKRPSGSRCAQARKPSLERLLV